MSYNGMRQRFSGQLEECFKRIFTTLPLQSSFLHCYHLTRSVIFGLELSIIIALKQIPNSYRKSLFVSVMGLTFNPTEGIKGVTKLIASERMSLN